MDCISSLIKRLNDNKLEIQNEGGFVSSVGFEWNNPAAEGDIINLENQTGHLLPEDYKNFLKISNGATLFKDLAYGQWGCNMLKTENIWDETQKHLKRGYQLMDSWIIIAKWLGDGDVVLIDLEKYKNGDANYLIDGDEGYQTNDWDYIKGGFKKWLDRLIVAQGAKYWRWY